MPRYLSLVIEPLSDQFVCEHPLLRDQERPTRKKANPRAVSGNKNKSIRGTTQVGSPRSLQVGSKDTTRAFGQISVAAADYKPTYRPF